MIPVVIVILAAMLTGMSAQAGILLEGKLNGVPLRIEMGLDRNLVLAEAGGVRHLVDLEGSFVYRTDASGTERFHAALLGDGADIRPFALTEWSEGPPVAGHGSRYSVLQLGETICGEVLASRWMNEFMIGIGQAIQLIQRVDDRLKPMRRETCGSIPFHAYTTNGWPLLAGWKDSAVFEADSLRFDHKADAASFRIPQRYSDGN